MMTQAERDELKAELEQLRKEAERMVGKLAALTDLLSRDDSAE